MFIMVSAVGVHGGLVVEAVVVDVSVNALAAMVFDVDGVCDLDIGGCGCW